MGLVPLRRSCQLLTERDQKHWAVVTAWRSYIISHTQKNHQIYANLSAILILCISTMEITFSTVLFFSASRTQKPRISSATLRFEAFDCIAEQPTSRTKGGFCITSTCVRLIRFTTGRGCAAFREGINLHVPTVNLAVQPETPSYLLKCLMFLDLLQSCSAHVYFLTHHILTAMVVIQCRIPLRANSVHPPVRNNRFSCITRIQQKGTASTPWKRIV